MMQKKNNLALVFILFIVFVSVFFAKNRYLGGDTNATLLVSESVIKRGTIKLDFYGSETLDRYGYTVQKKMIIIIIISQLELRWRAFPLLL